MHKKKAALRQFEESLSYDAIGVPWKTDRLELPDNGEQAMSRLRNTEK